MHKASRKFWLLYRALPHDIQQAANKQFAMLKANPSHPSVRFKKLTEKNGREIWSARVTLKYRALAIKNGAVYDWFWIGEHGTYDFLIR
jgi:mRNA-degrading endonuclease RelE of RelBE toxin-antitoxin system